MTEQSSTGHGYLNSRNITRFVRQMISNDCVQFLLVLLPSATVVAGKSCFHKCVSRIPSTGGCLPLGLGGVYASMHWPGGVYLGGICPGVFVQGGVCPGCTPPPGPEADTPGGHCSGRYCILLECILVMFRIFIADNLYLENDQCLYLPYTYTSYFHMNI